MLLSLDPTDYDRLIAKTLATRYKLQDLREEYRDELLIAEMAQMANRFA